MMLANLLDRSLGQAVGLRPRRLSMFERGGGEFRIEQPEVPAAAPRPAPSLAEALAPPSRSSEPDISAPAPEPGTPAPRIETVERTRIERIVTESAPAMPPRAGTHDAAIDIPAPRLLPPILQAAPTAPAGSRRRRREPAEETAEPRLAAAAEAPAANPAEQVRVIEQRLHTLSREWARETRVERTREVVRRDEAPSAPAFRQPASPPVATSVARPERLRPTAPPPTVAPDPVVEVHIGRVEVRATVATPPQTASRGLARSEAGLETYLRKRDGR